MRFYLHSFLFIFIFFSLKANSNIIKIEAEYKGELTWTAGEITIHQSYVTDIKKIGPFDSVDRKWGRLVVSLQNKSEHTGPKITTTNVKGERNFNYLSNYREAYPVINADKPLVVYSVIRQQTPEYKRWEIKKKRAEEKLENYNKLPLNQRINTSYPFYYIDSEPYPQYAYKILNEYHINIPSSEQQNKDYWQLVDNVKKEAFFKNFLFAVGILIGLGLVVYLAWYLFKKLKNGLYTLKYKAASKFAEKKKEKHQKAIRKIAEATAISETIKNEMKNTEGNDLQQLKVQIAESIEAGNYEKADSLLKIAERLKKLE